MWYITQHSPLVNLPSQCRSSAEKRCQECGAGKGV